MRVCTLFFFIDKEGKLLKARKISVEPIFCPFKAFMFSRSFTNVNTQFPRALLFYHYFV